MKTIMKNKSMTVWLLSVIVALTAFSSCEKGGNEALPSENITVMKLTKPEYKDFIIAYAAKDSLIAYRTNRTGLDGKSGDSPYWELSENWLLVDWKWNYPFPSLGGAVLLEDITWDKLTHALQTWSLETPHISQPIESVYYIKTSKIAEMLAKTYDSELINHVVNRPSSTASDAEKKEEIIKTMDDIWTILQADLSTIIEQGNLDKLCNP